MSVLSVPRAVETELRIYRNKPGSDTLIGMGSMRIFLKMQTDLDVCLLDRWSEDRLMEGVFRRLMYFDVFGWCDRLSSNASITLVQRRIVLHRNLNTPEHGMRCPRYSWQKCPKR
jgi:hypothetical protein